MPDRKTQSIFDDWKAKSPQEGNVEDKAPSTFPWTAAFVIGSMVLVGLVAVFHRGGRPVASTAPGLAGETVSEADPDGLPRLIELGSVNCIPCKMMKPILDELRREYAGRLKVDFIDVQVDREAGYKYGIRTIPTQVFLDADGGEVFRHEGFFPMEEILAKWKEAGIDLESDRPLDSAAETVATTVPADSGM